MFSAITTSGTGFMMVVIYTPTIAAVRRQSFASSEVMTFKASA